MPKNSGFTLLEIVLALALLGIGLVAVMGLLAGNTTTAQQTSRTQNLLQVKQAIINEVTKGNKDLITRSTKTYNYGTLSNLLPNIEGVDHYKLDVHYVGPVSLTSGSQKLIKYELILCYQPPASAQEVCDTSTVITPPTPVAQVSFGAGTTVEITIRGTPDNKANVQVVHGGGAVEYLVSPGTYRKDNVTGVRPQDVVGTDGIRYAGSMQQLSSRTIQIDYTPVTGSILLVFNNDIPGFDQQPEISVPGVTSVPFPTSSEGTKQYLIPEVAPGTYSVQGPTLSYNGFTLTPLLTGSDNNTFSVQIGQQYSANVRYEAQDGKLVIKWKRPPAYAASIDYGVYDTSGSRTILSSNLAIPLTLSNLDPNNYWVGSIGNIEDSAYIYELNGHVTWKDGFTGREVDSQNLSHPENAAYYLVAGVNRGMETVLELELTPLTSTLDIDIQGDSSLNHKIQVDLAYPLDFLINPSNPTAEVQKINTLGRHTFSKIPPGQYVLRAYPYLDSQSNSVYIPEITGSQTITVAKGARASRTVTYHPYDMDQSLIIKIRKYPSDYNLWKNEPQKLLVYTLNSNRTVNQTFVFDSFGDTIVIPPDAISSQFFKICGDTATGDKISYSTFIRSTDPDGQLIYSKCLTYVADISNNNTITVDLAVIARNIFLNFADTHQGTSPSTLGKIVESYNNLNQRTVICASNDYSQPSSSVATWRCSKPSQAISLFNPTSPNSALTTYYISKLHFALTNNNAVTSGCQVGYYVQGVAYYPNKKKPIDYQLNSIETAFDVSKTLYGGAIVTLNAGGLCQ